MSKIIMVGCDLHDRSMLIRYSFCAGSPEQATFVNDTAGREKMVKLLLRLRKNQGADRIVFAYEASGQGFGLSDLLDKNGIECHVLSPTHLPKTCKSAKNKTDEKDAQMLLEQVRGHVLAGNPLPTVWTPPQRLRDDRELVRARVDSADELTRIKFQILSMLKRRGIAKPTWYRPQWSKRFIQWLHDTAAQLDPAVAPVLENLVTRFETFHNAQLRLDKAVRELSRTTRYKAAHEVLRKIPGVGLLTAMTFLTEMGDLNRFHNRREVAAYLGLTPAAYESGEASDRKGRITRQGPSRVRKILCQSAWMAVRYCKQTAAHYNRIKQGQSKRAKKAVVAVMRRQAIIMWHRAMSCGVCIELQGRGGPHSQNPPSTLEGAAA